MLHSPLSRAHVCPQVTENAAAALANVAKTQLNNQLAVVSARGIKPLLELVQSPLASPEVQKWACITLYRTAQNRANKTKLLQHNTLDAMVKYLRMALRNRDKEGAMAAALGVVSLGGNVKSRQMELPEVMIQMICDRLSRRTKNNEAGYATPPTLDRRTRGGVRERDASAMSHDRHPPS